ncbi:MAG: HD domain-containing protein [Desulfosudaceae bacterium]
MKCPGQDTQYWDPEAIYEEKCPECGATIEFFKDDPSRKCPGCGNKIVNPRLDFGCAAYCPYAEQCLGTLPEEFLQKREELLKDRVAVEVKRYFQTDFKRIGHAAAVARHAEQIGKKEQGNLAVIMTAAYLHDIGIKKAEEKHNSAAATYQEQEGPAVAREILEKLGAAEAMIEEVCDIVGHHHHPRPDETLNFKVVYDADLIANLEEQHQEKPLEAERLEKIMAKSFLTEAGQQRARAVLL